MSSTTVVNIHQLVDNALVSGWAWVIAHWDWTLLFVLFLIMLRSAWDVTKVEMQAYGRRLDAIETEVSDISQNLRGMRNSLGGIQYDISGNRSDSAGWLPNDNYLHEQVTNLNAEIERLTFELDQERRRQ